MILFKFASIINTDSLPKTSPDQNTINKVLTIVFVTIGALALLFMVIAGIQYVSSQGNPEKVTQAKNRIIYTAIGLVLAASAWAIVNFVIGKAS